MSVEAHFETPHASKYLQQLCKHFAHKIPVEWTETTGHAEFVVGTCDMEARNGVLVMRCTPKSADALPALVKVVEVHLERFAYREPPSLIWLEDGRPASELMAQLRAMPDPHKAGETHDTD